MAIADTMSQVLDEQGRTQKWVVAQMNEINPSLAMDAAKFSAIMCDKRKMSGDELLAFCKAVKVSPDVFMK